MTFAQVGTLYKAKTYLFLNPIETGFHASKSKEKSDLLELSGVGCCSFSTPCKLFNFLYLKIVKDIAWEIKFV